MTEMARCRLSTWWVALEAREKAKAALVAGKVVVTVAVEVVMEEVVALAAEVAMEEVVALTVVLVASEVLAVVEKAFELY